MEKIWLQNYPKEIPHEIDISQIHSIMNVIEETSTRFSERPAFTSFGVSLSFSEIEEQSRHFAAYLQKRAGLNKGDRIAIQMPNILQFPVVAFAAQRAGLVVVNTNPLYTEREMLHQFNDAGVTAIVICANFADKLEKILPKTSIKTVIVTEIGDLLGFPKRIIVNALLKYVKKMVPNYSIPSAIEFNKAIEEGKSLEYSRPVITPDDLAFLQYTGGTTGVAKGAMLTQSNVIANMQQIYFWMKPKLKEGQEVVMAPLPMYHIFSLTLNLLSIYKYGGNNVLIVNPRDIPGFIKTLRKTPFTLMVGVNTLYNALVSAPEFADLDFSHLKVSVAGGMALQAVVAQKWKNITGTACIEGYGLTETSPVVCCNLVVGNPREGSIGLPLPSTEIKICDADGQELPLGEAGELWVRGPQVMRGYWQKPEETRQVLNTEGWLKTGDVANIDETGYVKIVDRKKDMILVSGFNVYPNEVEEVIAAIPGIVEVGVVGVPDEKSGEVVKAYVVSKDPNITEEVVKEQCRKDLTNYKVPKFVEFRTELPKTNVGKILRRELR